MLLGIATAAELVGDPECLGRPGRQRVAESLVAQDQALTLPRVRAL